METNVYDLGDDVDIISKLYQFMKNSKEVPYIRMQNYLAVRCHNRYCSNKSIWIIPVGNNVQYHLNLKCLGCSYETRVTIHLEGNKLMIDVR